MNIVKTDLKASLLKYFGFDSFKGEQEMVISSLLNGKNTFVIMPTGGGKSLCYQLPALISDGTAIVVSPLIALMKNQVDAIRQVSDNDGVAHFLNSSLNKGEITKVKNDVISGTTKLLYVAPESLTKKENIDFLKNIKISFFAIDEAHCISEWGHDFRPEYRRLKPIIKSIEDVPIIALTATATPKVQTDIQKNLEMTDAIVFKASFNRDNLFYEVKPKKNVQKEIIRFIKAFGCGPSPFYLNVSKFLENGRYATAQLTAHELGHCIGLRHTNTPQFSDLPRKDKFGWVNCNSKDVSNNIMGYNLCRNYLSPMQIGHIHQRYSTINELSLTTNNLMSNSYEIIIKKNTNWGKNILSKGTIIVKKNKRLL